MIDNEIPNEDDYIYNFILEFMIDKHIIIYRLVKTMLLPYRLTPEQFVLSTPEQISNLNNPVFNNKAYVRMIKEAVLTVSRQYKKLTRNYLALNGIEDINNVSQEDFYDKELEDFSDLLFQNIEDIQNNVTRRRIIDEALYRYEKAARYPGRFLPRDLRGTESPYPGLDITKTRDFRTQYRRFIPYPNDPNTEIGLFQSRGSGSPSERMYPTFKKEVKSE